MIKLIFTLICLVSVSYSYAQTALEKAAQKINMSVNLPSFLKASDNKDLIYATPLAENDSIPTLEQIYDFTPSFGRNAFKAYFHLLHSIIRHDQGDYITFIYVSEGGRRVSWQFTSDYYDRIKTDFRYGKRMNASSKADRGDLDLMLTHYPQNKAKEMFNADWMVMYPFNLRGEVYENKYSRCRAVFIAKEGVFVILYFMMPDEGLENFDNHLNDFKRVFWYNNLK